MSQVSEIYRNQTDLGNLGHENYVRGVIPQIEYADPFAAAFQQVPDGGYQLVGEKLVIALDDKYTTNFTATSGWLPNHMDADVQRIETVAARLYLRQAMDHYVEAIGRDPGTFENYFARLQDQALGAIARKTGFHIHAGSNAIVGTFVSRTNATTIVIDAGYGHAGTQPAMNFNEGSTLALLDNSNSFAVIGVANVTSVTRSGNQCTVAFDGNIDASSTGADGDYVVFATTDSTSDANFDVERTRAPFGLPDILDYDANLTTFLGLSESTSPRWAPYNRASTDFGHVELMQFLGELGANGNTEATSETHIVGMQTGLKYVLAQELLGYVQTQGMGMELQGGFKTVNIGDLNILWSHYHVPDVVTFLCPADLRVVNLDGQPELWAGDGSPFQRILDYDGKEWFFRHYVQRFAVRRNRMGCLTGVNNPNAAAFAAR